MPPKTKTTTTTTTTRREDGKPRTKLPASRKQTSGSRRNRRADGPPKTNPYLLSLLYPPVSSAKIPDPTTLPTYVATMTADETITCGTNGSGGIRLALMSFGGASSTTYSTCYLLEDPATTTDAVITYLTHSFFAGGTSFAASAIASRLVSASLEVEYMGSSLNDSGRIMGASLFSTRYIAEALPTSTSLILGCRDNVSVRNSEGLFLRWKPTDATCDDFAGAVAVTNTLGGLLVHISGAASGSSYRARMVCNYECIPKSDTISYTDATPSIVDHTSYDDARSTASSWSSFSSLKSLGDVLIRGAGLASTSLAYLAASRQIANARRGNRLMAAPAA